MRRVLILGLVVGGVLTSLLAREFTRSQAGKIAQTLGYILEQAHYRQAPFDDAVSRMFLTNYLDALDYSHLVFLQGDVDSLVEKYGEQLDDLTDRGDASPGFEIFELYLKRLEQRQQLVDRLLQEPQDFTVDEMYQPVRNKLPWPAGEEEADRLWRQRIKYELLGDKLIKTAAKKDKPAGLGKETEGVKGVEGKADGDKEIGGGEVAVAYDAEEGIKRISKRYQRLLKSMRELTTEDITQLYLTALGRAYDPHTDYLSPTEAENFEVQHIKLSLSGIGALLRWEDGHTKVQRLVPGGPAELSKQLKTEDTIIAVAQGNDESVDVVDMPLNKVVQLIRGKRGTEVRLTVLPADASAGSVKKEVRLVRDEIKMTEQFAKARVMEQVDSEGRTHRVGVINLPQFYERCARDVDKLIARLQKENITGLVLDLRRNGGGILDEAINLTGLFIARGPVVQVRDSRKQTMVYRDRNERVAYDGPLIVLVGHLSASASEIVAAALQDYGRAVIVGDQTTHGKGTVQSVLNLSQFMRPDLVEEPGKVKLTVSKFYRVAGGTTQRIGVQPDIVLPSIYDYMELGEASLPNPLPADGTTPVDYARQDRVGTYLGGLRARSAERVAASEDFAYIREDIEQVKKQRAERNVSLNEARRIQEREEAEKRAEARKKEREQRKEGWGKVFELTLEAVDKDLPLARVGATKAPEPAPAGSSGDGSPAVPGAEEEDEENPSFDPQLEETVKILVDYTRALPPDQGNLAVRGQPPGQR